MGIIIKAMKLIFLIDQFLRIRVGCMSVLDFCLKNKIYSHSNKISIIHWAKSISKTSVDFNYQIVGGLYGFERQMA